MVFSLKKKVEEMAESLIKPKRQAYSLADLGPPVILQQGAKISRHDLEIQGSRGSLLISSLFVPEESNRKSTCIIYLHSMGGSRLESIPAMKQVTELGYSFFTFDFPACGHSDGDIITFGIQECEDVRTVIQYLRKSSLANDIILWGRSMGAVTALLYASKYQDVNSLVADSAFSNMNKLILQLSSKYTVLPEFILKMAMKLIRSSLKERVGLDFDLLNISEKVKNCNCPVLLIASKEDLLVNYQHSKELFSNISGNKRILYIRGGHNEIRPIAFFEKVTSYISHMIDFRTPKIDETDELESDLILKEVSKRPPPPLVQRSFDNFKPPRFETETTESQPDDPSFISMASFSFARIDASNSTRLNKAITGRIVSKRYSQQYHGSMRTSNAEKEFFDSNRMYESIEIDPCHEKRKRTMSFAHKENSGFFANKLNRVFRK